MPDLPFNGPILDELDPAHLCDNGNYDDERRLMYVAMTRAERYLFLTSSRPSPFFRDAAGMLEAHGGTVGDGSVNVFSATRLKESEFRRDFRLVTSFSDLRYYLECPHDFYLRKVLRFAPTIDQAFGYGRAVHNIMRAIHSDPARWADLAKNTPALELELEHLINSGLFYLRYTTGEPAENMRRRAAEIIGEFVRTYADELERLEFKPEQTFEALIPEKQVLVSGAIDVIRLDAPRVTIIDFKSGQADSDVHEKLDEDEMRLQVSLYGLAA